MTDAIFVQLSFANKNKQRQRCFRNIDCTNIADALFVS
jgi:hypothetical protein